MNNYIMPHALSDIKSLHVTYYGWHDLPQGLWIINEYFKIHYISSWNDPSITKYIQTIMYIYMYIYSYVWGLSHLYPLYSQVSNDGYIKQYMT
jgi:hypothetical protein